MSKQNRNTCQGMTLLELLVVILIMGALSTVAVPAYTNHLVKAERNRAQTSLYQLQVWAEQHYTENNTYPNAVNCSRCQLSEEYNFSINNSGSGDNAYIITATPKQDSRQQKDECYALIINAVSETSNKDSDNNDIVNDRCWI
ncbi:type IV pilin protein [Veronia pacifica]|uniref:Prepilin-type N-terminal cleavage/methylation domain-containing protein n=1 Tax=Veronia pacifica TaxID=1080227 RepID=A0A1C3E734_9GAMM|nr:type IV pilin protein [Veronia pacifica]ODA29067.1 prepilin-type N-terminal cleavage/methylation domain-containing protein [Veronia pacifica]